MASSIVTLAGIALDITHPRPDAASLLARAREAEAAGVDFVVLDAGAADSALVAAALAAGTERVGIFARIPTATTEPFHVSTQLATIDFVSGGRAGWLVDLSTDAAGSVTWPAPTDVDADAREHVEVVRALWDSWEEGAEVRDAQRSRFLDRRRVHHIDFAGRHLAVRGPSITPRPPQGHPVIAAEPVVAARLGGAVDVRLGAEGADAVVVYDDDPAAALAAAARIATGAGGTLRARFGLPDVRNRFARVS